jgi:diguanylate cyclase (GGDEF)-like protein
MTARPSSETAPAGQEALVGRRALALFGAVVALWTALAGFGVERRVELRTAALVERQTAEIQQAVLVIAANVDRVFNRLQGLAAVLAAGSDVRNGLARFGAGAAPSPLPYEARKSAWTQDPGLLALSRMLRSATTDFGIDIVWVINAGGDCVAASNTGEALSFVGTHYGDREYFTSARSGMRGRQYAVGRVTKVPGLFFSAPVVVDGKFLGAVAVKSDLSRIASALNHPNAFVTDDQGVVILAADHALEMRALPGAAVHGTTAGQRLARYLRKEFATLDTGVGGGPGGLLRVNGSPHPHIAARSDLLQHGVAVHVLLPLPQIEDLREDALVTFLLVSGLGAVLAALAFGGRAYAMRARHYRMNLEAKNDMLSRLNEHLDALATVDPLTGLYNRRYMWEFLNREILKARRAGTRVAVILLDIDHFKRYNDTWGHQAGDAVLKHAADTIGGSVRGSDVVSRYGGEEMLVVLPDATLPVALERAEAIRHALHAKPLVHDGKPLQTVTASLGVSVFPENGGDAEALVRAADAALYEAKKAGRNRVAIAGKTLPAAA